MSELATYIDHLQKQNANDLSFYPLTTLQAAIESGRVLTCEDNGEPAGYIWHGPVRPGTDVIIYQACVDYETRRRHLGFGMVGQLVSLCKAAHSKGIRLRCASSSDSNEFWQQIGFYCTKVTEGGIKRARQINHWRTDVQTPLFTVDAVEPSAKLINLKEYNQMKRDGVEMPNRWAWNHYK